MGKGSRNWEKNIVAIKSGTWNQTWKSIHNNWSPQTMPMTIFFKLNQYIFFFLSSISTLLGHMCFSCYRTYVIILCNWLILWNLQVCSRNQVRECKFIKTRQLIDTCLTPPICRGLQISDFNSDFLGIRESLYEPSFLLTLDI